MKAKLLRAAGKIEDGADVEIVARAQDPKKRTSKPGGERAAQPAYAVRDDVGNQESVATEDFRIIR